jgi:hypothetical protein
MHWEIIKKTEIDSWNKKLKQTNATLFQYPYYLTGEYSSLFYKSIFIKYVDEEKELAFAAIIEIGVSPFKVGIIDDGPILLQNDFDLQIMLEELRKFSHKKHYMHLQIRPANAEFENLLKKDSKFNNDLFFPYHQKEKSDWNIYNQPEEELLASFKRQCRRKIVLAGRVPFTFVKLETITQLKDVQTLFTQVTKIKGHKYIAFPAMLKIYKNGKKYNLCDLYGVYLNGELVNAVFILKDASCFYHFTSAMLVKGYKDNESPPAKLHLFIMQDCFYNEQKKFYNISYGGTHNLIRFKELFNPVEIKKPPYYTYVINKKALSFFQKTTPEGIGKIRNVFRGINKHIGSLYQFTFSLMYFIIDYFIVE